MNSATEILDLSRSSCKLGLFQPTGYIQIGGLEKVKQSKRGKKMIATEEKRVNIFATQSARMLSKNLGISLFDISYSKVRELFKLYNHMYESTFYGKSINITVDVNHELIGYLIKDEVLVNEYGSTFGREYFITPVEKNKHPEAIDWENIPEPDSSDIWDQVRVSIVDMKTLKEL